MPIPGLLRTLHKIMEIVGVKESKIKNNIIWKSKFYYSPSITQEQVGYEWEILAAGTSGVATG